MPITPVPASAPPQVHALPTYTRPTARPASGPPGGMPGAGGPARPGGASNPFAEAANGSKSRFPGMSRLFGGKPQQAQPASNSYADAYAKASKPHWGGIAVGASLGLLLGGPFGALMGGFMGHSMAQQSTMMNAAFSNQPDYSSILQSQANESPLVQQLEEQNNQLKQENEALKAKLDGLESKLDELLKNLGGSQGKGSGKV